MTEIRFQLRNGIQIVGKEWRGGGEAGKRVLALHGWQDNCASFTHLAPSLAQVGCHVVAIDFPGHGKSSHARDLMGYPFTSYVTAMHEVLRQLRWDHCSLLGHSMGAGVATVFAATFPEKVHTLTLIENIGPVAGSDSTDVTQRLKNFLNSRDIMIGKPSKSYASLYEAAQARRATVTKYPGNQYISEEAALTLVARGTTLEDGEHAGLHCEDAVSEDLESIRNGPVKFCHDPLLLLTSPQPYTEEQVMVFIRGITSPTLLILADDGWPWPPIYETRVDSLRERQLLRLVRLAGSHHLHMDPDHREGVITTVREFLTDPRQSSL